MERFGIEVEGTGFVGVGGKYFFARGALVGHLCEFALRLCQE